MRNYKILFSLTLSLFLVACSGEPHFFSSIQNKDNHIEYQGVHQMSLNVTALNKLIDESGFAPILKCELLLENLKQGPWPQAWVAFNINIYVKGQKLATKAGALDSHQLMVIFDQNLPKFGLKEEDLSINVDPIAWMPTYPLNISSMDESYSEQTHGQTNKEVTLAP